MRLHTKTWRRGGITLVSATVRNPRSEPVRVRIVDRLGGPVWPPRGRGHPELGWDESGFEGRVGGADSLAIGYATPAPPSDPVAEIEELEQLGEREPSPEPEAILASFDDPRPPRSVLSSFASPGAGGVDGTGDMSVSGRDTEVDARFRCPE
ncbi:MAG: hypothetical protein ABEI31_10400 [Halodesulfurarchaeum sp.]